MSESAIQFAQFGTLPESIIDDLKMEKRSVAEISFELGIPAQVIYRQLRLAGISLRRFRREFRASLLKDYKDGWSIERLAKHYGISKRDVYKHVGRVLGLGYGSHTYKTSQRNLEIMERFQGGASSGILARDYQCSKQRICQIVAREAFARGIAIRKKSEATLRLFDLRPPKINITEDDVKKVREDLKYVDVLVERFGATRNAVIFKLKRFGVDVPKMRVEETRQKYLNAYHRYMSGVSAEEVAESIGVEARSLHVQLAKLRKELNLPSRYTDRPTIKKFAESHGKLLYDRYVGGDSVRKISISSELHYRKVKESIMFYAQANNLPLVWRENEFFKKKN